MQSSGTSFSTKDAAGQDVLLSLPDGKFSYHAVFDSGAWEHEVLVPVFDNIYLDDITFYFTSFKLPHILYWHVVS